MSKPWEDSIKDRRHHNNKGYRQIKRGKTQKQVAIIAKRLGIKYIPPFPLTST